ncbi:MAG TPA: S9 family peptidase [Vicinamibacterales bacterium]|nr:S9 family peptidase [Vicinamibacterales bacterium]
MQVHRVAIKCLVIAVLAAVSALALPPRHRLSAARSSSSFQAAPPAAPSRSTFQSSDLYRLKSVGDVQMSPDGKRIAYSVQNNDRAGRPYSQVWILDVATGKATRLGSDQEAASGPRWSRDGQQLAYFGREESGAGVVVSRADGSGAVLLAPVSGTNHPLPSSGERLAWSPDGKQVAFISAAPGPETENANGDPMVITRYLYKPTAAEGLTRFNDNRRLHVFIADVASRQVRQLTRGDYYEHSIEWSPEGGEILFVSNREPDPDRFFNYDVFSANAASGEVRRLTRTANAEYRPIWSPNGKMVAYLGTRRSLTSSETTMEDTHVWVMDGIGGNRRELVSMDNRQGQPQWSPSGDSVYFTAQERGSVRLYRMPVSGGSPTAVAPAQGERGSIGSWSIASGANSDAIAYALSTPATPSELFVKQGNGPAKAVTSLNRDLVAGKSIAETESLTFKSFDGMSVEAFFTRPVEVRPGAKYPLILMIHGGPHGQQGPAFNMKAQVYAAKGYGVLMVNYRGSTGYGQKFADAIFNDQDGGEGRDVLAGVDAALAKYPWLDANRLGIEGGSYGGQLTDWLITQTPRFKAAVPAAGIANLVSFNYMSYYHDYLAVEFGVLPHQQWRPDDKTAPKRLSDFLWERSALRYVDRVKTPVMFVHGENDNDVPIAEAEQYFIALKDAGVETIMVRYPREGHGIRETKHQVDVIDRSMAWYEKHFQSGSAPSQQEPR